MTDAKTDEPRMNEAAKRAIRDHIGSAMTHYAHHDPTGRAGAGCEACHAAAAFRAYLDSIPTLAQPSPPSEVEGDDDVGIEADMSLAYLADDLPENGPGQSAIEYIRIALRERHTLLRSRPNPEMVRVAWTALREVALDSCEASLDSIRTWPPDAHTCITTALLAIAAVLPEEP